MADDRIKYTLEELKDKLLRLTIDYIENYDRFNQEQRDRLEAIRECKDALNYLI